MEARKRGKSEKTQEKRRRGSINRKLEKEKTEGHRSQTWNREIEKRGRISNIYIYIYEMTKEK